MPHLSLQKDVDRRANEREEGAVLIVVLMMLLSVSATAVYTVANATSELRGASATRNNAQVQAMSVALVDSFLAWVDEVKPAGYVAARDRVPTVAPTLSRLEVVDVVPTNRLVRLYPENLASHWAGGGATLRAVDQESFNRASPSEFIGCVDVYDEVQLQFPIPGARSDGGGLLTYVQVIVSGRAITRLQDEHGTAGDPTTDSIRYAHRTGSTARAVVVLGPLPE